MSTPKNQSQAVATTYRIGDRVRVNPPGCNPFGGTVEEVGGRTVSVRATVSGRASTWAKKRVELLVPVAQNIGSIENRDDTDA